ncbi:MAG: hypothetical protein C0404_07310 [Verrucomicrobia bacterium]|nr:hypothetical protein [Verrucomicrobiota bacterium]
MRWVGHLLVWDEAMNLCSVRSLASNGEDFFSSWFWRHPPLFNVILLALRPLQQDFAERAELLAIGIGVVNIMLLFMVNSRVFNRTVALWSVFILAVTPGSAFFDVWVKTDHPATTFGLLALLLTLNGRTLYAGLSLGLAFLSKETAVFYACATVLLWLFGAGGPRTLRHLAALAVTPAISSGWWYIMVGMTSGGSTTSVTGIFSGGIVEHLRFAFQGDSGWVSPWYYYLKQIPFLTGSAGMVLAALGLILLIYSIAERRNADPIHPPVRIPRVAQLWPVFLLVPSYAMLSLLPSKVPWIPMILLPAWATLQGFLLGSCANLLQNADTSPTVRRIAAVSFTLWISVLLFTSAFGMNYDNYLRAMDEGQWRGATYSRQTAMGMNNMVSNDDRILITSFHYWKGLYPGSPCAVFTYYFEKRPLVLMRPCDRRLTDLIKDIRQYKIDWALLSPEPGIDEREVFGGLISVWQLSPCKFPRAILFRTTPVYQKDR